MIDYQIIASGSKGNAVVIHKNVLIDCGVPFRALQGVYKELKLVLLTHIHSDHFKRTTIKKLAQERPTLRFACGPWLAEPLLGCGVEKQNIDILRPMLIYPYPECNVIPVALTHNVPNYGYRLHFKGQKVFYATDTGSLDGISAWHYDLYLVEANYGEDEIKKRISDKKLDGRYSYEIQALNNHLSKEQCDKFIYSNIGPKGKYVYLHQHEEAVSDDYHSKDSGIRRPSYDNSAGRTFNA